MPVYSLLARMDYDSARRVWALAYTAIFLATAGLLVAQTERRDRHSLVLLLAGLVAFSYPFIYMLRQGQIDLMVGSLCFASFLLYRARRKNLSALVLAVATLMKLNPVFFALLYLVFYRDFKFIFRYGAAVAGLVLLFSAFFPPQWYWIYATEVLPGLTKSFLHQYNQTPLRYFAGDRIVPRLLTVGGAAAFAALAWFAGRCRVDISRLVPGAAAATLEAGLEYGIYLANAVMIMFVSGSAWVMSYVWFLLPGAALAVAMLRLARPWYVVLLGIGIVGLNLLPAELGTPLLDAANMAGGGLLLLAVLALYLRPRAVLAEIATSPDGAGLPG
ncbi:MAG: glycosyltransferase family 87 protein [Anaerolineaceae bacterium]|nr:glycosyltransferase family 87 protein [Anaerolineaceae bacterium]